MRVTVEIDSASAEQAEAFIFAYQRTSELDPSKPGLQKEPYVRILGRGWGIITPPVSAGRAAAMVREFQAANYGSPE